jgi:alkylation response protein AidB-like acyl-CoA dehydrogenase
VQTEGVRGCVWYAAWAGDHEEPDEALLAARVAKAAASELGLRVAEASVQVFGGIAITWEHLSHLRLRRVLLDRACFGNEHFHHLAIARHRTADGSAA